MGLLSAHSASKLAVGRPRDTIPNYLSWTESLLANSGCWSCHVLDVLGRQTVVKAWEGARGIGSGI